MGREPLNEKGELVGSGGFRIDRRKALEKLSGFQLQDGHQALLALIRCAVASGATRVEVQVQPASVAFDGRPLTAAELKDPFAAILSEGAPDPRARLLAVGLLGATRLSREISVTGGEGSERRTLSIESAESFTETVVTGGAAATGIVLKGLAVDPRRLEADCARCPIPVRLQEKEVPRERRPSAAMGLFFDKEGRSGWLTPAREKDEASRLELCQYGVVAARAELPDLKPPVRGYVNDDAFALDASQAGVVRDARYQETLGLAQAAIFELAGEVAAHLRRSRPASAKISRPPEWAARFWLGLNRWLGADPKRLLESWERVEADNAGLRWLRAARGPKGGRSPFWPQRPARRAALSAWMKEGRRFTEEEAMLAAFNVAERLASEHRGKKIQHPPIALERVLWSVERRTAALEGTDPPCPGESADMRALGAVVVRMLGGEPERWRELPLSPGLKAVVAQLLERPGSARPRALMSNLSVALGGAVPLRLARRSPRILIPLLAVLAAPFAGNGAYRWATGPDHVLSYHGRLEAVAFSADAAGFAARGDYGVLYWDTKRWQREAPAPWIPPFRADAMRAASPDGLVSAFSSGQETIAINAPGGVSIRLNQDVDTESGHYRGFTGGAFSPDGKRYAAPVSFMRAGGTDRYVRVWDTKGWALLAEKRLYGAPKNGVVRDVAIGGGWLAVAIGNDFDGEVHFWRLK